MLQSKELSPEQKQPLGRALMTEEDDWLDWKVATEMLQSWLGLREEVEGATRNRKVLESADRYQETKSQLHNLSWQVGA